MDNAISRVAFASENCSITCCNINGNYIHLNSFYLLSISRNEPVSYLCAVATKLKLLGIEQMHYFYILAKVFYG